MNNKETNNLNNINNFNGSRVNNIAPSGASIKSILKSGGFRTMEDNKKLFFRTVESISNSRTVEILGGLGSTSVKEDAINVLGELWKQLQSAMSGMSDSVTVMNFDMDTTNFGDVV